MTASFDASAIVNTYIRDPANADFLSIIKAGRNGAVHGAQIRFPHALVMTFIYHKGSFISKIRTILLATFSHAKSLAILGFTFKAVATLLRNFRHPGPLYPGYSSSTSLNSLSTSTIKPRPLNHPLDAFIAGCVGGYAAFGRDASGVNTQIVLFIFSRVAVAAAKILHRQKRLTDASGWTLPLSNSSRAAVSRLAWPVFATLVWGCAMYQNELHSKALSGSVQASMKYIAQDCDYFTDLRTLLLSNT